MLNKLLQKDEEIKNFVEWTKRVSFEEYLELVKKDPSIVRNSYQRIFDMINSYGKESIEGKSRYAFFDDKISDQKEEQGKDAIFGIDKNLSEIVNFFENGAKGLGAEKRILLLHGPVGSAKSSISRLLKKGLEKYSKQEKGKMYTYYWVDDEESEILGGEKELRSPMNEDPLKLLPEKTRLEFISELENKPYKKLRVKGGLNPACRFILKKYLEKYNGDLEAVLKKHIKVVRLILSEEDRIGIGTFQPKDEKNQDSTELTGDVNYRKIAEYGSDSDPRAFNFDGEFNVANRGIVEFVEMLKLDTAFLYDLLGASQEQSVKPKKFPQTDIDEVILGHTNEPEFRKLQNNEFMEALRDRTVKIDIPYITKLDDEIKIYEKDFSEDSVGMHIAPHTIKIASLFSVLSRLEDPQDQSITLLQKMMLYNGQKVQNKSLNSVQEMRKISKKEGLIGISPRYIQDKISNAIIKSTKIKFVHPFIVLKEIEDGLEKNALISNEADKKRYKEVLNICKGVLDDELKKDVINATIANEEGMKILCANYIDNIKAYTSDHKIRNKFTNSLDEADEKLMRSIEERIDIPEARKDDFRREIMNFIGGLAIENKKFTYKSNERLQKALESKLFEDTKSQIKLNTISSVIDDETQEKINTIKSNLVKKRGYTNESAKIVLDYVTSLLAKGESLES